VKVKRRQGKLRVDLEPTEASLLAEMFDDLSGLLADPDADDPVIQRLYPQGYTDDEAASAEYRELVESDLRAERTGRLQACRAEVPPGGGRVELDDEAADRWIRVINDLRLAIGTRLGVTEDEELPATDESGMLYHWLSAVQEMLVMHLMA
jgi:hypothetical protein